MDNISVIVVFLDAHKKAASLPKDTGVVSQAITEPVESGTNDVAVELANDRNERTVENKDEEEKESQEENESQRPQVET